MSPGDRDMRWQNILQTFLFVVFFFIGASAVSLSILCDELLQYYEGVEADKTADELIVRLESLNSDYEMLLEQLERDPNLFKRVAVATLGIRPEDTETVYPKVTPEQLDVARKALTEDLNEQSLEPVIPLWLSRCSEPRRRSVLFLAGGFLILISLICFGSAKRGGAGELKLRKP